MPGAGSRAGEKEQPAGVSLLGVHRTAGEKAVRSPAQETFNDLGAAQGKGPRTRVIQLAAGVRKRSRRRQRSNRRLRGGRSASAAPQVRPKGPEFLAWVLVLFVTSWAMMKMVQHRIETDAGGAELDPVSASRSGRALILVVRRRESRARSQANGPGRGWTLQFSGLETLEKARQRSQLFTNL